MEYEGFRDGVPYRVYEIEKVTLGKVGFEVMFDGAWSLFIEGKYAVRPKIGDKLTIYGERFKRIQGIKINNVELYFKTNEQMKKEHDEWRKETAKDYLKEYNELMERIKDEESFETINISGMGGGYERACQMMLRAGIKHLEKNPDFHFDYFTYPNIYGVAWTETPWGKELDKVLMDAIGGDCTGAMHQCVIGHLAYIHKQGYNKWLEELKERKYTYPHGLPKPSFCEGS